jgi:hypothetical protein
LNYFKVGLLVTSVWLAIAPADAAPPASCASKFVGSWMVRVNATGQTYPAQIFANGRSHATCPLCTPGGSWTCSGNTISYTVDNGATGQATLSEDGRTTTGGCCTSTRMGPAPRVAPAAPVQQAKVVAPEKHVSNQRQSCSDITGTGGAASAPSDCGTNRSGPSTHQQARLSESETRKSNKPRPWKDGGLSPDEKAQILALGDLLIAAPDTSPQREALRHLLERRLAALRVRTKARDLACLQPVSGTSRPALDIPLRWRLGDIKKEAIDRSGLCNDVPEGDAKEACREAKYGEAVMWAEPELAGQCRGEGGPEHDTEKVAECARRKFLNAWAKPGDAHGIVVSPTPDNWVLPADCNASASPEKRRDGLRDRLRRLLDEAASRPPANDDPVATMPVTAPDDTVQAPAPPPADDDEAYCNAMADDLVRGTLTSGGGMAIPPGCKATIARLEAKQKRDGKGTFRMDGSETDKEIKRLTAPAPVQP